MSTTVRIFMNVQEVQNLIDFLQKVPESERRQFPLELSKTETGIGAHIEIKSGNCQVATDLTDYKSW